MDRACEFYLQHIAVSDIYTHQLGFIFKVNFSDMIQNKTESISMKTL